MPLSVLLMAMSGSSVAQRERLIRLAAVAITVGIEVVRIAASDSYHSGVLRTVSRTAFAVVAARPLEISSRSANLNRAGERRRGDGRIPPHRTR